jgi:hypothetical protein
MKMVNFCSLEDFTDLMDALVTRIKGGIATKCDEVTVNMYYQAVALKVPEDELLARYQHIYF